VADSYRSYQLFSFEFDFTSPAWALATIWPDTRTGREDGPDPWAKLSKTSMRSPKITGTWKRNVEWPVSKR
jgi:hypothetical protein